MAYYYKITASIVDDRTGLSAPSAVSDTKVSYNLNGSASTAYGIDTTTNVNLGTRNSMYFFGTLAENFDFVKYDVEWKTYQSKAGGTYTCDRINPINTTARFDTSSNTGNTTLSRAHLVTVVIHVRSIVLKTLIYSAEGATNIPEPQTFKPDEAFNLSAQIPEKTDETFDYWGDGASGKYSPGQSVVFSDDVTLFAVWKSGPGPGPGPTPTGAEDHLQYTASGMLEYSEEDSCLVYRV